MSKFAERRAQRYRGVETESSSEAPPDSLGVVAEPAATTGSAASVEWFDMEDAPKNNTVVWLRGPAGVAVEAKWRPEVRHYDRKTFRWQSAPGWFYNWMGAPRIDFEPDAWARAYS
jgi:hypothetical protein